MVCWSVVAGGSYSYLRGWSSKWLLTLRGCMTDSQEWWSGSKVENLESSTLGEGYI